jgi:hypothetical protein
MMPDAEILKILVDILQKLDIGKFCVKVQGSSPVPGLKYGINIAENLVPVGESQAGPRCHDGTMRRAAGHVPDDLLFY